MDFAIKDVKLSAEALGCIVVRGGRISSMGTAVPTDVPVFSLSNGFLFPGFVDVHVHLREPGFSYKETIETGTMAAAHGGYTDICAMPNLNPVPDSPQHLAVELEAIRKDAAIRVHPYGAITVGQQGEALSDLTGMAKDVLAFSDDGRGVQSEEMMRNAMEQAKKLGKIIVAHCEDNSLLHGGYIHDGDYCRTHGHRGICSESEWGPIARDLRLVEETGCAYHVCHISTKESVRLIREAKARGVNVTCETAPHYLLLDDSMLGEDGCYKMNPPIRDREDREELVAGLLDGTIDMIATDHAPHSAQEKQGGLEKSINGIVGIETAFAAVYTGLVKPGILTLDKLIGLLHHNACARFGIGSALTVGAAADFTIFDLDTPYEIDPSKFLSMGNSTPFAGQTVYGRCRMTVCGGKIVWDEEKAP